MMKIDFLLSLCGTKNTFYWAYMKKKRWIMLQFYGDEKYFSLVLYR